MWTRFMDMHSGGGLKETHQYILIEAPQDEAEIIFYNRFNHSPNRISCTCCGSDYSISTGFSLEQVTASEYLDTNEALIIRNEDISEEERLGSLPERDE